MNCESVQPLLLAFLDNELADDERDFVLSHVGVCDVCGDLLAIYKKLADQAAEAFEIHRPGKQFAGEVMQTIRRDKEAAASRRAPKNRIPSIFRRPLPLAAGFLLAVCTSIGMMFVLQGNPEPGGQPLTSASVARVEVYNAVLARVDGDSSWRLLSKNDPFSTDKPFAIVTGPRGTATLSVGGVRIVLQPLSALRAGPRTELLRGTALVYADGAVKPVKIRLPKDGYLAVTSGTARIRAYEPWRDDALLIQAIAGQASLHMDGKKTTITGGHRLVVRQFAGERRVVPLPAVRAIAGVAGAKPRTSRHFTKSLSGTSDPVAALLKEAQRATARRHEVLDFLATIPKVKVPDSIVDIYADSLASTPVRLAAGRLLASAGQRNLAELFLPTLQSRAADEPLRIQAARVLGEIHSQETMPAVAELLPTTVNAPELYAAVARSLYLCGDEKVVPRLRRMTSSGDHADSLAAVTALGRVSGKGFFLPLAKVASNASRPFRVRVAAAKALWRLNPSQMVQEFRANLNEADNAGQVESLTMLAAIDEAAAADTARMILEGKRAYATPTRLRATVIAVGLPVEEGTPLLKGALDDPDHMVRLVAAEALLARGNERALAKALEALKSSNWYVMTRAAEIVGRYGKIEHVLFLGEMHRYTTNTIAMNAANDAMKRLDSKIVLDPFNLPILPHQKVRFAMLTPLGREFGERTRKIVESARAQAGQSPLVRHGNEFAILRLIQLAVRGQDRVTRAGAIESLRKLTGRNFGFDPYAKMEEREEALVKWDQWWNNNRTLYQYLGKGAAIR